MSDDMTICSLSTYLIEKTGKTGHKFFDTDLVRVLNDTLRSYSISCFMMIFDEYLQSFRSMIWSNLEEKDPPFGEYVKTERFQQYIRDILKDPELSDKPYQIFAGQDLSTDNSLYEEPYIRSMQDYYPNLSIKYCIKAAMGRNRNIWLILYKRDLDGDFTKSDVELINCICGIIACAHDTFELHHSNIEMLSAINGALDYFDGGVVTFDKDLESISFMGLANDIIHSITGCVRKTDALDTLLRQIHKTGTKDGHVVSAVYRDYKCYLEEPRAFSDHGYVLLFPYTQSANGIDSIPDFDILTSREKEVAICLASGLSYRDISEDLFISISTVRNHVTNIYRKLNINNQRQLISLYFGKTENRKDRGQAALHHQDKNTDPVVF